MCGVQLIVVPQPGSTPLPKVPPPQIKCTQTLLLIQSFQSAYWIPIKQHILIRNESQFRISKVNIFFVFVSRIKTKMKICTISTIPIMSFIDHCVHVYTWNKSRSKQHILKHVVFVVNANHGIESVKHMAPLVASMTNPNQKKRLCTSYDGTNEHTTSYRLCSQTAEKNIRRDICHPRCSLHERGVQRLTRFDADAQYFVRFICCKLVLDYCSHCE